MTADGSGDLMETNQMRLLSDNFFLFLFRLSVRLQVLLRDVRFLS